MGELYISKINNNKITTITQTLESMNRYNISLLELDPEIDRLNTMNVNSLVIELVQDLLSEKKTAATHSIYFEVFKVKIQLVRYCGFTLKQSELALVHYRHAAIFYRSCLKHTRQFLKTLTILEYYNLGGQLYHATRNEEEARKLYKKMVLISERLLEADPDNLKIERYLGIAYNGLANSEIDKTIKHELYEDALTIFVKVMERFYLVRVYKNLAFLELELNQPVTSLMHYIRYCQFYLEEDFVKLYDIQTHIAYAEKLKDLLKKYEHNEILEEMIKMMMEDYAIDGYDTERLKWLEIIMSRVKKNQKK